MNVDKSVSECNENASPQAPGPSRVEIRQHVKTHKMWGAPSPLALLAAALCRLGAGGVLDFGWAIGSRAKSRVLCVGESR